MTGAVIERKGQDFDAMVLGQGVCPALKCICLSYLIALIIVISKIAHHQDGEVLHILSHTGSICVDCHIGALDGLLQHILIAAQLAAVQQLILSHNMLLPHHLIQGSRTEPGRQGRLLLHILFSHIIK